MKLLFMIRTLLLSGAIALTLFSCSDDWEDYDRRSFTMRLTFVPVGGGPTVSYAYDKQGGETEVITKDTIVLSANKSYNVSLLLLDRTNNPVLDLTKEVAARAEAFRFYYDTSTGSSITVSDFDLDQKCIPLGITSTWTTGSVTNGTMKITLRRYGGYAVYGEYRSYRSSYSYSDYSYPKNKAETDSVNSKNSSTDIQVQFDTKVQ